MEKKIKNEKDYFIKDEEKMKKSFKSYGSIAELFECLLEISVLIVVIVSILIGIFKLFGKDEQFNIASIIPEYEELNYNSLVSDFIDVDESELAEMPKALIGFKVFFKVSGIFIIIVILNNLKKMFYEIAQDAKPFTDNNVRRITTISWLALALWITTNMGVGLISVICLFAVAHIFRCGYKLQIESDETL